MLLTARCVCHRWVIQARSKNHHQRYWQNGFFYINLSKCDFTEFDGKVHSVSCYKDRTYKGKLSWNQFRVIYIEARGTKGWVRPSCWATRFTVTPLFFLKLLVELRLNLSLRPGQWFMSKGINYIDFISTDLACYQQLSESVLWIGKERKDLSGSGKEYQTLRDIPAQESPACSPIETEMELEPDLSKDMLLSKDLSASKDNFEGCPSSRGDHHHTATLQGREISKKALSGSHIYGIKWLTQSDCLLWEGYETPCTHNFLDSLTNESWKNHCCSCFKCMISVPSSCALMLTGSLCPFLGFLEEFLTWMLLIES